MSEEEQVPGTNTESSCSSSPLSEYSFQPLIDSNHSRENRAGESDTVVSHGPVDRANRLGERGLNVQRARDPLCDLRGKEALQVVAHSALHCGQTRVRGCLNGVLLGQRGIRRRESERREGDQQMSAGA